MKLNCKQGDLAVIVKSWAGNEGKIVNCLEFIANHRWVTTDRVVIFEPTWRIDIQVRKVCGGTHPFIMDSQLRPIRDTPGDDETLQWCDVPSKVTA